MVHIYDAVCFANAIKRITALDKLGADILFSEGLSKKWIAGSIFSCETMTETHTEWEILFLTVDLFFCNMFSISLQIKGSL